MKTPPRHIQGTNPRLGRWRQQGPSPNCRHEIRPLSSPKLSALNCKRTSAILTSFERSSQKVISRRAFAQRMARAAGLWMLITAGGLAIGIVGYAHFEGMRFTDAFLNAAMILSGMGPSAELKTQTGKIFAGCYAIFSGLIIVIATGFVLAPIFHRVLHKFHVETSKDR